MNNPKKNIIQTIKKIYMIYNIWFIFQKRLNNSYLDKSTK